jgi:hypothetical protein
VHKDKLDALTFDKGKQMVAVFAYIAPDLVHGRKLRALGLGDIEDIGIAKANQYGLVLEGGVFRGFLVGLALHADDRREDADALLAFLHLAAKLVPCIQSGHAGGVRPLPCNFEDIAKAVIVKTAHGVEVGREGIAAPCLQLRDKLLDIGGDDLLRRLPLLRFLRVWGGRVDGGGGGDGVHRVFPPCGIGRCLSCHAWHVPTCRTPPGEGGGSKAQGEGDHPSLERSGKDGA